MQEYGEYGEQQDISAASSWAGIATAVAAAALTTAAVSAFLM